MFQYPPQVTLLTHAYPPSPLLPSPLLSPHPPRPLRLFPLSPSPSLYRPFSGPSPSPPFSSFCSFDSEGLQSLHHPSATNQSSSQYLRTTSEDLADTLSLSVNNVFIHFKNLPTTQSHSLPRHQRACSLSWSPVSTAGIYPAADSKLQLSIPATVSGAIQLVFYGPKSSEERFVEK